MTPIEMIHLACIRAGIPFEIKTEKFCDSRITIGKVSLVYSSDLNGTLVDALAWIFSKVQEQGGE